MSYFMQKRELLVLFISFSCAISFYTVNGNLISHLDTLINYEQNNWYEF